MPADDRSAERISRRHVLLAGGGAAAVLAGCGSSASHRPRRPEDNGSDADVVDGLLGVGNRAVAAYAYAAGFLTGRDRALVRRIGVQEADHVYALTGAVDRLGGNPSPAPSDYAFAAASAPAALRLAAQIEDMTIAACLDAMPKLYDLRVRGLVGGIAANDAQHAVLIAQARRLSPLASAIVRGLA